MQRLTGRPPELALRPTTSPRSHPVRRRPTAHSSKSWAASSQGMARRAGSAV